ncbi:MAG: hypothetical protein ACXAD7_08905 [Candidatus Kariarchaeaceae archaeon]
MATAYNLPVGRYNDNALVLRTDGTNGSIAVASSQVAFDEYYMSFWYKTMSYNSGEKLRITYNDSSVATKEFELNELSYNTWQHVLLRLNLYSELNVTGFDETTPMVFEVIDNDGVETNVYIYDAYLVRFNNDTAIQTTPEIIGVENNPIADIVVTPKSGGLEVEMAHANDTSIVSVRFNPHNHEVELYINGVYNQTLVTPWHEGLFYRINFVGEPDHILVGVWEATTLRSDRTVFTRVDVAPGLGSKQFKAWTIDASKELGILNRMFLENSGFESGVEAIGFWELGKGTAWHKTDLYNDKLTLVDSRGNYLLTRDYTMDFDYILNSGDLVLNTTGIDLVIEQNQITVNDNIIYGLSGQTSGHIKLERYGTIAVVWLDGQSIVSTGINSEIDDRVVFSGFGDFELSAVKLYYEKSTIRDSSTLVLEGPTFMIKNPDLVDLSQANDVTFRTRRGSIDVIIDEQYDGITAPTLTVDGMLTVPVWDIHQIETNQSRYFKFIHVDKKSEVKSVTVSYEAYSASIKSEIVGDERLAFDSGIIPETIIPTDADSLADLNNYSNSTNINTVTGSSSDSLDYVWYNNPIRDGKFSVNFYIPELQGSQSNKGTVRLVMQSDGADEEYIELRSHEANGHGYQFTYKSWNFFYGYYYSYNYQTYALEYGNSTASNSFVDSQGSTDYSGFFGLDWSLWNSFPSSSQIHNQIWLNNQIPGNANEWVAPDLNGLHTLDVYAVGSEYIAYLDGNYLVDFARSNMDSTRFGIGVSDGANAFLLGGDQGSIIKPEGVDITGRFMTIKDELILLPDGTNHANVTTQSAWNLYDISSVSASFVPNNSSDNTVELMAVDNSRTVGVNVASTELTAFDNDCTASCTTTTEIVRIMDYSKSRSYWMEIYFESTSSEAGSLDANLITWDDMSVRNVTSAYTFDTGLDATTNYKLRVSALTSPMHVDEMHILNTRLLMAQSGTEEIEVVEGSGTFPVYNVVGQTSHAAKFSGGDILERTGIVTGSDNSSLHYATDIMIERNIKSGNEFKVQLLESSNQIAALVVKGDEVYAQYQDLSTQYVGDVITGEYFTASIDYNLADDNFTIAISGNGISGNFTDTVEGFISIGDVITFKMELISSSTDEVFVDNVLLPGYNPEEFIASTSTDGTYNIYDTFTATLEKDRDMGARYVSVFLEPMSENIDVTLKLNGESMGTKTPLYDLHGGYQQLLYFIPKSDNIDTTRLTALSIETNGLTRLATIGFLRDQAPDMMLAASATTSSYEVVNYDGSREFITGIPNENNLNLANTVAEGGRHDISGDRAVLDPEGYLFNTETGKLVRNNVNLQYGFKENTTSTFHLDYGSMFLDGTDNFIEFGHSYVRNDLSVLGLGHSQDDFTAIVMVDLLTDNLLGTGGSVLPFYIIANIGTSASRPGLEFGISSMDKWTWKDSMDMYINASIDDPDLNLNETYAWYTVDLPTGDFTTLDIPSIITAFTYKMDQLRRSFDYTNDNSCDFNGVVNPKCIAHNKVFYGQFGDYNGRFDGVRGIAFGNALSGAMIDNIMFMKNVNFDRYYPTHDRKVSYFDESVSWEEVYTSRLGDANLANKFSISNDTTTTALLTSFVESVSDSMVKIRFYSNLPALLYLNDYLVTSINTIKSDLDTQELIVDTIINGGTTKVTILAIHPEIPGTIEGWNVGYSMMADAGLDFSIVGQAMPGLDGDYIKDWVVTDDLLAAKTETEYQTDVAMDDLGNWHDMVPVPGESYALKSNPDLFASVVVAEGDRIHADGSEGIPLVPASALANGFIEEHGIQEPEGVFMASSTIHLSRNQTNPKLSLTFFIEDLDNLDAVLIDGYRVMYIEDELNPDFDSWVIFDDATTTAYNLLSEPVVANRKAEIELIEVRDPDGMDSLEVSFMGGEGFVRISYVTSLIEGQNITHFWDGAMDVGVSATLSDDTPLADNIFVVIEPTKYDTNNYKLQIKQYFGSDNSDGDSATKFSPLDKENRGMRTLTSAWFVTADGSVHLKRERYIGFKSLAGPCSIKGVTDNTDLENTGSLYTQVILDPGTPQMASSMVQQWITADGNNKLEEGEVKTESVGIAPTGQPAVDQSAAISQAVSLSLTERGSAIRDDRVVLTNSGISVQVHNQGYRIHLPDGTQTMAMDMRSNVVSLVDGKPIEDEALRTNSIADIAIPDSRGKVELLEGNGVSLAGRFTSLLSDSPAVAVSFATLEGDTGVLYPALGILQMLTADDFEIEYHLVVGYVKIHQVGSNMARTYTNEITINWFDLHSSAAKVPLEKNGQKILTQGTVGSGVEGFSLALAQMRGDPSYEDRVAKLNSDYEQQVERANQEKKKKSKGFFGKCTDWVEDTAQAVGDAVETAVQIASVAIKQVGEMARGAMYLALSGDFAAAKQMLIDMIVVIAQAVCSIVHNFLSVATQIIVQGFKWIKDKIFEWIGKAVSKLWGLLMDFIKPKLEWIEDKVVNWNEGWEAFLSTGSFGGDISDLEGLKLDFNGTDMREDLYDDGGLEAVVRGWGLNNDSLIVRLARYQDLVNKAKNRFFFISAYSLIFGSAIGFQYRRSDLFPKDDSENENDKENLAQQWKVTRSLGGQLLQLDKSFDKLGYGKERLKIKIKIMETIIQAQGWTLTYDATPIYERAKNTTKNFHNFDVIARPSENGLTWNYFLALESDLKIPITLLSVMGAFAGGGGLKKKLLIGLGVILAQGLAKIIGKTAADFFEKVLKSGGTQNRAQVLEMAAIAGIPDITANIIMDALAIIMNFDPGIILSIGPDYFGLVGLDDFKSLAGLGGEPAIRNPNEEHIGDYKTDDYGRKTEEKRWKFNIGVSENAWIMILEMAVNFIPGYGEFLGLYQDVRDCLFADTVLDQVIGFVMILPDLGSIGEKQAASSAVKKGLSDGVKDGFQEASLEYVHKVPKGLGWLQDIGYSLNKFGGGGGSGAIRTALFPVIMVKRLIFLPFNKVADGVTSKAFSKGSDEAGGVLYKISKKYQDKIFKNLELKEAADLARLDKLYKDGADRVARETAEKSRKAAKAAGNTDEQIEAAGELAYAAKKMELYELNADYLDEMQEAYSVALKNAALKGGFDTQKAMSRLTEEFGDGAEKWADEDKLAKMIELDGIKNTLGDPKKLYVDASNNAGRQIFGKRWVYEVYNGKAITPFRKVGSAFVSMFQMLFKGLNGLVNIVKNFPAFIRQVGSGFADFWKRVAGVKSANNADDVSNFRRTAQDSSDVEEGFEEFIDEGGELFELANQEVKAFDELARQRYARAKGICTGTSLTLFSTRITTNQAGEACDFKQFKAQLELALRRYELSNAMTMNDRTTVVMQQIMKDKPQFKVNDPRTWEGIDDDRLSRHVGIDPNSKNPIDIDKMNAAMFDLEDYVVEQYAKNLREHATRLMGSLENDPVSKKKLDDLLGHFEDNKFVPGELNNGMFRGNFNEDPSTGKIRNGKKVMQDLTEVEATLRTAELKLDSLSKKIKELNSKGANIQVDPKDFMYVSLTKESSNGVDGLIMTNNKAIFGDVDPSLDDDLVDLPEFEYIKVDGKYTENDRFIMGNTSPTYIDQTVDGVSVPTKKPAGNKKLLPTSRGGDAVSKAMNEVHNFDTIIKQMKIRGHPVDKNTLENMYNARFGDDYLKELDLSRIEKNFDQNKVNKVKLGPKKTWIMEFTEEGGVPGVKPVPMETKTSIADLEKMANSGEFNPKNVVPAGLFTEISPEVYKVDPDVFYKYHPNVGKKWLEDMKYKSLSSDISQNIDDINDPDVVKRLDGTKQNQLKYKRSTNYPDSEGYYPGKEIKIDILEAPMDATDDDLMKLRNECQCIVTKTRKNHKFGDTSQLVDKPLPQQINEQLTPAMDKVDNKWIQTGWWVPGRVKNDQGVWENRMIRFDYPAGGKNGEIDTFGYNAISRDYARSGNDFTGINEEVYGGLVNNNKNNKGFEAFRSKETAIDEEQNKGTFTMNELTGVNQIRKGVKGDINPPEGSASFEQAKMFTKTTTPSEPINVRIKRDEIEEIIEIDPRTTQSNYHLRGDPLHPDYNKYGFDHVTSSEFSKTSDIAKKQHRDIKRRFNTIRDAYSNGKLSKKATLSRLENLRNKINNLYAKGELSQAYYEMAVNVGSNLNRILNPLSLSEKTDNPRSIKLDTTDDFNDTQEVIWAEMSPDLINQLIYPLLEILESIETTSYIDIAYFVLNDRYEQLETEVMSEIWDLDILTSKTIEIPLNSTHSVDELVYTTDTIYHDGISFELMLDESLMNTWHVIDGNYTLDPLMLSGSIWNPAVFMTDEEMSLATNLKQSLYDEDGLLPQFDGDLSDGYSVLLSNTAYLYEIQRQKFSYAVMPDVYWVMLLNDFTSADLDYLIKSYYNILLREIFSDTTPLKLEQDGVISDSTFGEYFEQLYNLMIADTLSSWKSKDAEAGSKLLTNLMIMDQIEDNNKNLHRGTPSSPYMQRNNVGRYLFAYYESTKTRFDELFIDNTDSIEEYISNWINPTIQFRRLLKSPNSFIAPMSEDIALDSSMESVCILQSYFGIPGQFAPNENMIFNLMNRFLTNFKKHYDILDVEYVSIWNDFIGLFTKGDPKSELDGMNPSLKYWLFLLEGDYDVTSSSSVLNQFVLNKFI